MQFLDATIKPIRKNLQGQALKLYCNRISDEEKSFTQLTPDRLPGVSSPGHDQSPEEPDRLGKIHFNFLESVL